MFEMRYESWTFDTYFLWENPVNYECEGGKTHTVLAQIKRETYSPVNEFHTSSPRSADKIRKIDMVLAYEDL